ncbi:probable carbohydrate esterase At4g34215 [Ananas comosus]|uniref:Probable carbohydrate esterase At4g34215 n=1 Tax=Ananas comosus TaxID=4615 RepID=A0A6P5GN22_ANACO|nr:probable carbohydrate esterase At4g34215 [Ananas comosus]
METSNGGGSGDESAHVPPPLASDPAPRPAAMATIEKKKHIFVLSGQSNMSGRGGVRARRWDGVVPSACGPAPSAVLRLSAGARWEDAREPLHADIDTAKTCGVGPGMAFANALLPRLPVSSSSAIGLVPCAVGGTAIREWEPGTHLYAQMVRRAKEAVAGGGELRAVLWYQGESDATEHAAPKYRSNMEKLIKHVRSDLNSPDLPFIQVAIASGDKQYIEEVRKAQLGIDMPNVVCVDAKGLQLNEDNLHLSTEAQVELGNMLAQAYIKHFLTCNL